MSELKKQIEDQAMGKVYFDANMLAIQNNQTIGENRNYYITLEQLELIIKNTQELLPEVKE